VRIVTVRRSTVVGAPVEAVWEALRDFNDHGEWHPAVVASAVEGGRAGDSVGCVRRFALRSGGELREQLLSLDDRARSCRYCILDSPIPLVDYVATVRLRPVTDGDRTFWEWEGSFRAPPGEEDRLAALVAGEIYEAGFAAIERRLGGGASPAPGATAGGGPMPAAPPGAVPRPAAAGRAGAMLVTAHGGPEVLRWGEVAVPPPGPGEVTIRHTAIGVNFIDVYARTGLFRLVEPPGVPGMEAAGVVEAAGPGVIGLTPGDRVAYACAPPGAYATSRTMPAELVLPLPDPIDDVTAAAGLLKGMTACLLVERVHPVRRGETVLVHAAAGGTGLLLCQWARALGATVIGTVSSDEKARAARAHGCAWPIVLGQKDFVAAVRRVTGGRGCDVVYDAVGGETFARSYAALAPRGHLVSFGQAAGRIPPPDVAAWDAKSARLSRPNFLHYAGTRADALALADALFAAVARGAVRIPPPRTRPLREAAEAHRELEARRTTGATVLLP
jgi:NADPH:quinone reductase